MSRSEISTPSKIALLAPAPPIRVARTIRPAVSRHTAKIELGIF
jgi:hypothetical protein